MESHIRGTGSKVGDRLAVLLRRAEGAGPYFADELRIAWLGAEEEVRRAYADWRDVKNRDSYAVYLAALDREERAAHVYADLSGHGMRTAA